MRIQCRCLPSAVHAQDIDEDRSITHVPMEQERLVEHIEDIDEDVVVGGAVDGRPRELAVDEDHLLRRPQDVLGPVRHLPLEEVVGVLRARPGGERHQHEQRGGAGAAHCHRRPHHPCSLAGPPSAVRALWIGESCRGRSGGDVLSIRPVAGAGRAKWGRRGGRRRLIWVRRPLQGAVRALSVARWFARNG